MSIDFSAFSDYLKDRELELGVVPEGATERKKQVDKKAHEVYGYFEDEIYPDLLALDLEGRKDMNAAFSCYRDHLRVALRDRFKDREVPREFLVGFKDVWTHVSFMKNEISDVPEEEQKELLFQFLFALGNRTKHVANSVLLYGSK